jgi:hypothetical protein
LGEAQAVGRPGLAVEAVGVDLQQYSDTVPGTAVTSVAGTPALSHKETPLPDFAVSGVIEFWEVPVHLG